MGVRRRVFRRDVIILDARTGTASDVKLMSVFYNNLHIAKNPLYLTKREAEKVVSNSFPGTKLSTYDPENIITDLSVLQYFTGVTKFYYIAFDGRTINKISYPPSIRQCVNTELKNSTIGVLEFNNAPVPLNRDFQVTWVGKIIVPSEYLDAYKTTSPWNFYSAKYEGKL